MAPSLQMSKRTRHEWTPALEAEYRKRMRQIQYQRIPNAVVTLPEFLYRFNQLVKMRDRFVIKCLNQ
jgi:hypothetical protein